MKKNKFYQTLIFSILILIYGCGKDSETIVVDFTKTIEIDRPQEKLDATKDLRVAVAAMVSPKETFTYYHQLLEYLGEKADRNIQFIQRKTYQEINELFTKGQIDIAFLCSGPYATGKQKYDFEILATPRIRGSHFYQAYLIVNKDSSFVSLEDLKGHSFAFTDPDSNTGRLVPTYWLHEIGEQPETFYSRTFYTFSHDNAILAVSKGLVDGAAVDGLIWEYYHSRNPSFIENTKIIKKSESYGIPPLVVSKGLPPELKGKVHNLIFSMHLDPNGQKILKELMIDRFIEPKEEWYDSIRQMALILSAEERTPSAF